MKVCGGSWLTPADAVAAKDWARITQLAQGGERAARLSIQAPQPLRLDQLDLVAVRVGDEGDHGRAAFHRPGLARDVAAVARIFSQAA